MGARVSRLLTPKFIMNIPGSVAYNKNIPAAVRDTYTQLRGLAWGKKQSPPLTMDDLIRATGKSRNTLYEHMRFLRSSSVFHWQIRGESIYIFSFHDELSENSDLPLSTESNPPRSTLTSVREKRERKSENSDLTDAGRAWLAAYVDWLGYEPGNATKGDIEALVWLAEHYTPEQGREVYDKLKADPFWERQQIKPVHLRTRVPEHFNAKARKNGSAYGSSSKTSDPLTAALLARRGR